MPKPQAQVPLVQLAPLPHWVVQVPQANGSVFKSTQALLQLVRPEAQTVVHLPNEQTWPEEHLVPQPPQLLTSLWVSTHAPEHSVVLLGHLHCPL